ncbi:acyl-CoA dehydrogenase family protein [Amycolatopsis lurida]
MSIADTEIRRAGESIADRAGALRPVLERDRAAGDRQRRLTGDTVDALTGAGMFRLLVPRRFGGDEVGLRTAVDVAAELAHGDPAASWVVMILGSADWITGLYPESAQREVYADGPDTRVCAVLTPHSTARPVDGGWLLNGSWAPASGCLHAQWAIVGFPMSEKDGNGLALVPMRQLRQDDTWFTAGMRGTGSNLLIGEDVFVPQRRVLPMKAAVAGEYAVDRPDLARYRSAFMPTLATYMIGPYLGMASAALEYVTGQAGRRGISFTNYGRQSDSTAFQLVVAEAAAKVDAVRLLAHNAADVVDGHAAGGTFPDYLTRARIRLHTGYAVRQCREAVDALISAYGASAMAESNPLQAYMRDIHAASRHAVANPAANAELFGRALLGVEPNITELI